MQRLHALGHAMKKIFTIELDDAHSDAWYEHVHGPAVVSAVKEYADWLRALDKHGDQSEVSIEEARSRLSSMLESCNVGWVLGWRPM